MPKLNWAQDWKEDLKCSWYPKSLSNEPYIQTKNLKFSIYMPRFRTITRSENTMKAEFMTYKLNGSMPYYWRYILYEEILWLAVILMNSSTFGMILTVKSKVYFLENLLTREKSWRSGWTGTFSLSSPSSDPQVVSQVKIKWSAKCNIYFGKLDHPFIWMIFILPFWLNIFQDIVWCPTYILPNFEIFLTSCGPFLMSVTWLDVTMEI